MRRLLSFSSPSLSSTSSSSSVLHDNLLLLLLSHNKPLFYRFSLYLSYQEPRKKAKESAYGVSELEMPVQTQQLQTGNPAGTGNALDEDGGLGMGLEANSNTDNQALQHRPEDAWDAPLDSPNSGDAALYSTNLHPKVSLQQSPFSIFEQYALPLSPVELNDLLAEQQNHPSPGVVAHFQRLKTAEIVTRNMSGSEYVMYTEARGQASFSHNKVRAKRFREFISPQMTALDIQISDDLLESLGFISHEIVVDLLERAKGEARRRILGVQGREKREKENAAATKGKTKGKGGKVKDGKRRKTIDTEDKGEVGTMAPADPEDGPTHKASTDPPEKGGNDISATQPAAANAKADDSASAEAEAAELAASRAIEEENSNLRPTGPFSASFSSLGFAYPTSVNGMTSNRLSLALACPATIDDPVHIPFGDGNDADQDPESGGGASNGTKTVAGAGREGEGGSMLPGTSSLPGTATSHDSTKVQSQMPSSDIVSNYDVLLGDYEEAVLGMKRGTGNDGSREERAVGRGMGRGSGAAFGKKRKRGFLDCF